MIAWLIGNFAWTSLVMLVVLVLRRPFAAWFGAGPAYALWLLPAARLVMPPLPSLAPDLAAPISAGTLIVWAGDAAAPLPPDGGPGQWVPILLALWALGAAGFLARQWFGYRRFLGELGRSARSLGTHRGLALVESAAVQGPVALGLLDRRIVVPADFGTRYTAAERGLALDHEAVHHRRGDIWWNHLALLVLAASWFNPLAWIAFRAFRADQELACDAAVAAGAPPATRHAYASALVKSASRPGLIAACPLNHADQLKRRLKMMKDHRRSRARMLGGAAFILALAGAGLAFGSPGIAQPDPPGQDQAQPREERHEHRVIVRTGHDRPDAGEHREHSERVIVMTHRGEGHGDADHAEIHGDGGELVIPACDGGARDEINEGTDHDRTRIVLCSRGTATLAERAERLAHVRERLAADSELSAEQRARVTAAIDREIARIREQ